MKKEGYSGKEKLLKKVSLYQIDKNIDDLLKSSKYNLSRIKRSDLSYDDNREND